MAAVAPSLPADLGAPEAVLLDSGGVFLLPTHDRILGAFARAEADYAPAVELIDRAHYVAATRFHVDLDVEAQWRETWQDFLGGYVEACGTPVELREEIHVHLDSEFADAALWMRPIVGAVDGLRALAATGVRLGIISNADGLMAERLRELEILQVGPGIGVEVETVIDSGAVGVMKPDARIFQLALDAMGVEAGDAWYVGDMPAIDVVGARRAGLHAVVMDPYDLHGAAGYDCVASLHELATRIASLSATTG
jgi:putative hydrolase of the HAD superfamily